MTGFNVEFWLILQMVIEVLLCGIIICYVYRDKSRKGEMKLEQEKIKTLVDSLHRLVKESEALDKKHQEVLKLWEKIEKKGAAIEAYIDHHERKMKFSPKESKEGDASEGAESEVTSYEKASRLIEEGLSTGDIAQKSGLPRGEVELMVNLKRQ